MCGICGIVDFSGEKVSRHILKKMCDVLTHRGPDDEGMYLGDEIGFGARRLSIIDIKGGHQPVHNEDESIWLVFNGEIYNYKDLREKLEARGHRFYTFSDTETIVHLYEEYGEDSVRRLNGMFAFAIWDKNKQKLFLARDRLGIKPLYYYHSDKKFIFASEIKSILQNPGITRQIDTGSLNTYLTYQYIPSPSTIFEGIKKLPPGYTLSYEGEKISIEKYWDIEFKEAVEKREEYYTERIMELFRDSVKMMLVSDVPYGAFLSGGIDSSSLVAIMASLMDKPVETFSMGFAEPSFSELKYARLIAERFKTNHHEFVVTSPDIIELLPEIISYFDEPFGDSSAIPTFMVARLAKTHVKMVLSGDGGDELFGGYERYLAVKLMKYYLSIPPFIREKAVSSFAGLMAEGTSIHNFRKDLRRFICSKGNSPQERYIEWMSALDEDMKDKLYSEELKGAFKKLHSEDYLLRYFHKENRDLLRQFFYVDIKTYLPEDLLTKVDRMSMANSLEVRVPLLDHRLVEFAFKIPPHLKLKGITTKYIFKKAISGFLPGEIIRHRKHGFGVPIGKWFRKELKDWSQDILLGEKASKRGYFNMKFVKGLLEEHQKGLRDHSRIIWSLLVLELWQRIYMDRV